MSPHEVESELSRLRDAIVRVDEVIVRLRSQRAQYAEEMGELTRLLGLRTRTGDPPE